MVSLQCGAKSSKRIVLLLTKYTKAFPRDMSLAAILHPGRKFSESKRQKPEICQAVVRQRSCELRRSLFGGRSRYFSSQFSRHPKFSRILQKLHEVLSVTESAVEYEHLAEKAFPTLPAEYRCSFILVVGDESMCLDPGVS